MFRKLRNKMLLINMALVSLVMVASFTVIYAITYSNAKTENYRRLNSVPAFIGARPFMQSVTGYVAEFAQGAQGQTVVSVPVDYTMSFSIMTDSSGQIMSVSSLLDIPDAAYEAAAEKALGGNGDDSMRLEGRDWLYSVSKLDAVALNLPSGGVVTIEGYNRLAFLDITDSNRQLRELLVTFAIVGIGMLAILFMISLVFANRAIKPIERNWERQRQFVADASHELRTPVAIIEANADALLADEPGFEGGGSKWVGYIKAQAQRMSKLTNSLLFLARAEDADTDPRPFSLSAAALSAAASFEAVAYERGIMLEQDISPDVLIKADEEGFNQVIAILLDNAIKYAGESGAVGISVRAFKNAAELRVTNTGKGIDKDDIPRIFDRFYRADPSRSHDTGGYGLGLAIAKTIVEKAGGSIKSESQDGLTAFTVTVRAC